MKTIFTLMLAIGLIVSVGKAQENPPESGTERKMSPEEEAEIDDLSDICDALKKAYDAKITIEQEKKIGKVSGAVSLTKLNQAGRDIVEGQEEADRLIEGYKKKYKEFPDLDNRCRFFVEMDAKEKRQLIQAGKKARKGRDKKGK